MKSKLNIFVICVSLRFGLQNAKFLHAGGIGVHATFGGSRISAAKAGASLRTDYARIQRFQQIRVSFERKAGFPICWKR
jgi:hypothetical protein